ncbi:MAG: DUF2064 domain-containing protein [Planctomycetes bacterium]|nr:DUF2064 domain-containing protein [Planctomycetota bacterium]
MVRRRCFTPASGAEQLEQALIEDCREVLHAAGLPLGSQQPLQAADLRGSVQPNEAAVVVFTDVPGLPLPAMESLPQILREADVVLGPCADGGIYLLAWSASVDRALTEGMCNALASTEPLAALTDLLTDAEAEVELLPSWFRLSNERDFNVIDCVARLSVLSEDGEDDFSAERLRQWFEKFTE